MFDVFKVLFAGFILFVLAVPASVIFAVGYFVPANVLLAATILTAALLLRAYIKSGDWFDKMSTGEDARLAVTVLAVAWIAKLL